jgi:hypothetical protein
MMTAFVDPKLQAIKKMLLSDAGHDSEDRDVHRYRDNFEVDYDEHFMRVSFESNSGTTHTLSMDTDYYYFTWDGTWSDDALNRATIQVVEESDDESDEEEDEWEEIQTQPTLALPSAQ